MLETRDITLNYGITQPLCLTLQEYESAALVGPNGAGKTSLMRCMAGQLSPQTGSINIQGESIMNVGGRRRAELVGFLPQTEAHLQGFTVREVVSLGRYARRYPFKTQSEPEGALVEEAVEAVGLEHLIDRLAETLSGGEYQRVRIARTLAQSPHLMLLDEPLAHLDPGQSHRVAALISQLGKKQQATSLTALHDLNLASLYFDRILLLNDGDLVADGTPEEVMREDLLNSVYGTSFKVVAHPNSGRPQVLGLGSEAGPS